MDKPILMKDSLGKDAVIQISQVLSFVIDDFPAQKFIADASKGLNELELKQRVEYLITVLARYLPADFSDAAPILIEIKNHWFRHLKDTNPHKFYAWPLIDYVSVYGLDQPELALKVLKTLTPLFSAEFSIRPFIEQHYKLTYAELLIWCKDPDEHVRRLSSEGIRPRLPWGRQLKNFRNDPTAIFPILESLKDDPSLYVRKSVANNLNDIAKDHPDKVIELCQNWLTGATVERQWIIRHALRSLVKAGNPKVFPLLGYTAEPKIQVKIFELSSKVLQIGQTIILSLSLLSKSTKQQTMIVDYKVHHVKANGRTSSKVFKWKNIVLPAQQQISFNTKHAFKLISTRKYYAGLHSIEVMINGVSYASEQFELQIKT